MNAEDAEADDSQHSDSEKEKDHEAHKTGWGHLQVCRLVVERQLILIRYFYCWCWC